MEAQLSPNRSAEYNFRTPFDKHHAARGEQSAQQLYYARLLRVSISHTYYNLSNDECPDFTISPTPATSALLRSLGLLFKSEPAGFSILYNEQRRSDLANYLKGSRTSPPGSEVWPRLSFTLSLNNPYFVNFTDIPFDLDPGRKNFYFTNRGAHRARGGKVILNPGDYVQGVAGLDLFEVIPVQYPVRVDKFIKEVRVKDISGQVVICEPRCLPHRRRTGASPLNCDHKQTSPPSVLHCRETIYLDFSSLPEDKYRIEKVFEHSQPGEEELAAFGHDVLYTTSAPPPLCFIDLLFTDPTGSDQGIYPVRDLFRRPEFVAVNYQLRFRTRAPFWTYYIVPQPQREKFEDLRIESVAPTKSAQVHFAGPCCVYLANGEKGYRFVSEKAIPLHQQAPFRFRLLGRHDLMQHDGIIVENMPVASRQQILRDELAVLLDVNKNLCPQAKDKRCQRLVRRLGRSLRADSGFAGEPEELKRLSANPRGERMRELRQSALKLYSDTYVYV